MSRTKILIVEDDRHVREVIRRVLTRDVRLRHFEIEVIQAADGVEGLERFREQPPDLVVADLLMPRMDGFELIEAIREQPSGKACPILVTTGVYRDPTVLEVLQRKYDAQVLLKPFLPRAFADAVHRMLQPRRVPAEKLPPPKADQPPPPPKPAVSPPRPAPAPAAPKEAAAPAPPGAPKVLRGELTEKTPPALLLELLEQRLSGSLDLKRGKVRKVVHIMSGHPIFVQSNLRSETLGQMLVRRGKLGPEQHAKALAESQQHGIKYGEALVRLGYMDEGQVMAELQAQTRLKLAACLGWEDGAWAFTEDPEVGEKVPRCVVDPVRLVLEGLREQTDVEEAFARVVASASQGVKLAPRFDLYRDRFVATYGSVLIDALAPGRPVSEVLRCSGAAQEAVTQLDVLLQTGLAVLEPLADGQRPTVEVSPSQLPLEQLAALEPAEQATPEAWPAESSDVVWLSQEERARLSGPPARDTGAVTVALQLVQSTYLTLHDANHYEVLGVTTRSDADSIEVAYHVKRKQFDLSNFRDMDLGVHYTHLEEICAKLDTAYHTLSDQEKRQAYDQTLAVGASQEHRSTALAAEMHCRRGEELFNRKSYRKAQEAFAQALELDEQAEYQAKYALAYFMGHRSQPAAAAAEAMLYVQQALAADPGDLTAHLVAATISREAGNSKEALAHLQELIKLDPTHREAFDEAEKLLGETGKLRDVERHYRRTLHMLGDKDREWAAELWRRLTFLYRDRMNDLERARTACAAALKLSPEREDLRTCLAELEEARVDRWPQAVLGHRSLLQSGADQATPAHELFRLHTEAGRADAAYMAACVAELRGVANEEEQQVLQTHRPRFLKRACRPLEPALWESLRHPDDDSELTALFGLYTPVLQAIHPLGMPDLSVEPEDLVPEEALPDLFASVLRYAAAQLSMQLPRVARRPELGEEIDGADVDPPVLLVGSAALDGDDRVALCFRISRALTLIGPGRRSGAWRARRLLRDYVLAAVSTAFPEVEVPDPQGMVERIVAELASQPEIQTAVKDAVAKLRRRSGSLNLATWQWGIRRTADRAGLLLCTDLVAAARIVGAEDAEAERDLVDFALSEGYGELRSTLGLALVLE